MTTVRTRNHAATRIPTDAILLEVARMSSVGLPAMAVAGMMLGGCLAPAAGALCMLVAAVSGALIWSVRRLDALGVGVLSASIVCDVALAIVAHVLGTGESRLEGIAFVLLLGSCVPLKTVPLLTKLRFLPIIAVSIAVSLWIMIETQSTAMHGKELIVGTIATTTLVLTTAVLIARIVPRVVRDIEAIGDSFARERRATAAEAKRRASARLLHDTVLATLTLLAHGGSGVPAETLRAQAARDAELLRELRLGRMPEQPVDESGGTVDGMRDAIERHELDLTIVWSGLDDVAISGEAREALRLAMLQCLKNVVNHAGVDRASVTLAQTPTHVHAIVTDNGAGFDPDTVPDARLGFRDSVAGRMRAHGGSARAFSAPGTGTTVILELPR